MIPRMPGETLRWTVVAKRIRMALRCAAGGLLLSACSASSEGQNQHGAADTVTPASSAQKTERASSAGGVQPVALAAVSTSSNPGPSSSSITTGSVQQSAAGGSPPSAQARTTTQQRCEQLRQESDVWQRSRKLAVLNRGEAGGRMADLHTPWTKENVVFYLATCNSKKQLSRPQTHRDAGQSPSASVKMASARE
jgi:hypothetical protein